MSGPESPEPELPGEFMKQFGGSAAANGITGIILLVILGLRKLCNRKSKCKSKLHTCCLDVEIRDETMRTSPPSSKTESRDKSVKDGEHHV